MTDTIQIIAILVSTTLLVVVLELVRRHKLTEEYSFIWILCSLGLLGLSIWRESLHTLAHWLGIFYPPALLLLVLLFFVFVASLYFSVVISRQRGQIERLVQEMAILSAEHVAARRQSGRPFPGVSAETPAAPSHRDPG